jgi:protocatechuate 3,4-dioxygenase beta subunit
MNQHIRRREFLGAAIALSAAAWWQPGAYAEDLLRTPRQTEGPFYPDKLPLDTDNDLIIVNNNLTPAIGAITHLTGKVTDIHGSPIRNALIEIWQVDGKGVYLHTDDSSDRKRDSNFQGYGKFLTSSTGEYYFRTIKPVKYPGRTPHIHWKISRAGKELLTTQCYIKGEKSNDRDMILRGIRDAKARETVLVDFVPMKESKAGELTAQFDIVLGVTPGA